MTPEERRDAIEKMHLEHCQKMQVEIGLCASLKLTESQSTTTGITQVNAPVSLPIWTKQTTSQSNFPTILVAESFMMKSAEEEVAMTKKLVNGVETQVEDTDKVYSCPKCGEQILLLESEWHSYQVRGIDWMCVDCEHFFDLTLENQVV